MHHTWSLRLPSVIAPIAVLIGSPIVGSAEPVKMHTQCTCTCVAFDELGQRHDGSTFTFDTPGGDCSIGQKVGCYIGDLKGSYSSCTGKSLGTHLTPGGGAGVMQPPTAGGGMRPPAMGPVMGRGTDSEQPAASPTEQEDMAKGGEAGGTGDVQGRGIQRAPLGTIRAPVLGGVDPGTTLPPTRNSVAKINCVQLSNSVTCSCSDSVLDCNVMKEKICDPTAQFCDKDQNGKEIPSSCHCRAKQ